MRSNEQRIAAAVAKSILEELKPVLKEINDRLGSVEEAIKDLGQLGAMNVGIGTALGMATRAAAAAEKALAVVEGLRDEIKPRIDDLGGRLVKLEEFRLRHDPDDSVAALAVAADQAAPARRG